MSARRMRSLILSDIHSNLPALQSVLNDAETAGDWDEIWCLGDTVGYGAQPNECFQLLRKHKLRIIAGNHDLAAAGELDTSHFNPAALAAISWTATVLSSENRDFIKSMSSAIVWEDFTLAHASPREPVWEYVTSTHVANANFDHFSTRYCLVGHTHIPQVFVWDDQLNCSHIYEFPTATSLVLGDHRMIVNPGSVGQPRSGDPRASYAILDSEKRQIRRRPVAYPIDATQRLIRDAGLPDSLAKRLDLGY